jgi:hypothetical protein
MSEEIKPNVSESKYAPMNLEQFQQLKGQLESVKNYLPENLMGPFWTWCNTIRGERINQPCSCKGSAKHWSSCVDTLRTFVKERSE